jgi:hypothetical protein
MRTIADVIKRVRRERIEMPGLRPIPSLLQRLRVIELRIRQMVTNPSAHPAPQVVQSDGTRSVRETLMLRQPERRRSRSDTELRKERARWEQQWEQQWNDQHPPQRDSASR